MISTRFSFTKEDIKNAFELHFLANFPIRSKLMLISGVGLMLTGLVLTIKPDIVTDLDYLKFVFFGIGLFYIAFYFYRKRVLENSALESPSLAGEQQLQVTETEVSFKTDKGIAGRPWDRLKKAVSNDKTLLLYFSDNQFFIIPKRTFNQADKAKLESLAKKNIEEYIQK